MLQSSHRLWNRPSFTQKSQRSHPVSSITSVTSQGLPKAPPVLVTGWAVLMELSCHFFSERRFFHPHPTFPLLLLPPLLLHLLLLLHLHPPPPSRPPRRRHLSCHRNSLLPLLFSWATSMLTSTLQLMLHFQSWSWPTGATLSNSGKALTVAPREGCGCSYIFCFFLS